MSDLGLDVKVRGIADLRQALSSIPAKLRVAATPSTADLFDITALTPAATEDIGSLNGGSVAHGYFKSLTVS